MKRKMSGQSPAASAPPLSPALPTAPRGLAGLPPAWQPQGRRTADAAAQGWSSSAPVSMTEAASPLTP